MGDDTLDADIELQIPGSDLVHAIATILAKDPTFQAALVTQLGALPAFQQCIQKIATGAAGAAVAKATTG